MLRNALDSFTGKKDESIEDNGKEVDQETNMKKEEKDNKPAAAQTFSAEALKGFAKNHMFALGVAGAATTLALTAAAAVVYSRRGGRPGQ